MVLGRLHMEVLHSASNGKSRFITRLTEEHSGRTKEIFHEIDRVIRWTDETPFDGYILAILLHAAATCRELIVHGPVSRTALRNISELLLAWCRWKPHRYHAIEISPERVLDQKHPRQENAIAAFSGGVDSTFTVLRYAAPGNVRSVVSYPLHAVLVVHGFDVDVYNTTDFQKLVTRVRPLADELGLDLRQIRTNSRDLRLQDWEDSCGLELAACMHMYAHEFNIGLIGSSNPYDELDLPWGSNPITDHMMSGDRFAILHDGAGFSRTEKVAQIMTHPLACKTLKVCWTNPDQAENCGNCEKCVRTQLNFLAAGALMPPTCFPRPMQVEDIYRIQIDQWAQMVEFHSIVAYCKVHNVTGPWLNVLQERIADWRPAPASAFAEALSIHHLKQWVVAVIGLAGLREPTLKAWRHGRRHVLRRWRQVQDAVRGFSTT